MRTLKTTRSVTLTDARSLYVLLAVSAAKDLDGPPSTILLVVASPIAAVLVEWRKDLRCCCWWCCCWGKKLPSSLLVSSFWGMEKMSVLLREQSSREFPTQAWHSWIRRRQHSQTSRITERATGYMTIPVSCLIFGSCMCITACSNGVHLICCMIFLHSDQFSCLSGRVRHRKSGTWKWSGHAHTAIHYFSSILMFDPSRARYNFMNTFTIVHDHD